MSRPQIDPETLDKLRGGYYTPEEVVRWLTAWAVRSADDEILEPSCGDGVFLAAAAERLRELGASKARAGKQLTGIEIIPEEAAKSAARLRTVLGRPGAKSIRCGDFFEWLEDGPARRFDCAIGNPPFIRYQNFPEPSRSRAMALMGRQGLRANKLTNIWVPFVVGAISRLRPGGRLAFVIPAELLQVTYAGQLRSYLADWFSSIQIFACNDLFFERAEQEVLLLLAEGRLERPSPENRCRIELTEAPTVEDVLASAPEAALNGRRGQRKTVRHDSEKWLKYFLTAREISLMRRLRELPEVGVFADHAEVDVGVVTGRNAFFVLSREQVTEHGLGDYAVPLVGRSSQLVGAVIKPRELRELGEAGEKVFLFFVDPQTNGALNADARKYVQRGEKDGVHKGYKCSIRDPWYTVPSVWRPDCFLFRQIYDFPRIVLNATKAVSTDTIHRVRCGTAAPEQFAANLYTHLTAASAEIEGRSYGGGVLELEPTEAEHLLVPRTLADAMPLTEVDRLVRLGKLDEVLLENDRRVLRDQLGLSARDCTMLRRIWEKMRDRRRSRSRRGRRRAASG